ncbi:zinc-ribbon domain-containing protein [Thioclava sp. 'Guangxiensis']|uniref:zinc-ribbon domain-containing protein n=1 Tax=Thioclava sp. 'Guangxiensis' TaxID=3149044 RepID=UPI00387807B9
MRLTCPKCAAQYEVSDKVIPDGGRDVQCANCQTMWFQPSARMLAMPHPAEDPRYAKAPGFSEAPQSEWQPGGTIRNLADADRAQDLHDDAIAAEIAKALEDNKALPEEPVMAESSEPEELSGDPDNEIGEELRPAPQPGLMPRRKLDDGLLAILREEAEREAQARRAEGSLLQTQEEMNLEPVAKAAASRVQAKLALLRQTQKAETAQPVEDRTVEEDSPADTVSGEEDNFWPEGTPCAETEDGLEDRSAEYEPDEAIPEDELSFGEDAFEAVLPAPEFSQDDPEDIPVVAAYAEPLSPEEFANEDPDYHIGATLDEDDFLGSEEPEPEASEPQKPEEAAKDKAHVSVSYTGNTATEPEAPQEPEPETPEEETELLHVEPVLVPPAPPLHPVDKVNHFSRRDQLPDIEEINSTLRATSDRGRHAAAFDAPQTLARQRSGFRLGFGLVVGLAVIMAALYLASDQISATIPALQVPLAGYVAAVDQARLALDIQLEKLIVWLGGTN